MSPTRIQLIDIPTGKTLYLGKSIYIYFLTQGMVSILDSISMPRVFDGKRLLVLYWP